MSATGSKTLVVIPTFNERENITRLIPSVLEALPTAHILVVDDNSPDGTANAVKEFNLPNVHLLLREKKNGLGRAYLAGFAWGLERDYEAIVEMDADFSHRPVDLVKIVEALKDEDFVVGSRWVDGGGTKNWSFLRYLVSRGGSLYTRLILGFPLFDWTGGFNAWKRKVLETIDLKKVQSEGYSFQIELKFRALKAGFKGREVPIFFENRKLGESKMSSGIFLEALVRVWKLRSIEG